MPTFVSPTSAQWSFAESPGLKRDERDFWGHYGAQLRGITVLRTGGVWASVSNPTTAQIEAADLIVAPNGTYQRAVLLGGHESPVTAATATELTAAGYGAYLTSTAPYPATNQYPSLTLYPEAP